MNDRFVMFTLNEIKGTLDGANPLAKYFSAL